MDSEPLPSNAPPPEENKETLMASHQVKETVSLSVEQAGATSLAPQKNGNSSANDTADDALTASTERSISMLRSSIWWRNVSLSCLYFVPYMIKPYAFFLIAISIASGMLLIAKSVLSEPMQFQQVFMLIGMYLVGIVIVPAFIVLWLTSLLARITAFCLTFQRTPRSQFHSSGKLDKETWLTNQKIAVSEIPKRNAFLARYWGLFTVYMLFPFSVACVSFIPTVYESYTTQYGSSPGYENTIAHFPPVVGVVSTLIFTVLALYITLVSLVGIALSASTQLSAASAVVTTFKFAHKHLWRILLITVVVTIMSVLISAPQEILQRIDANKYMPHDLLIFYLEQVWWSFTGLILPTLSMAPVCEYMRGNRERLID